MVVPVELPDAIRHATLFPESDLPAYPAKDPTRRVEVEGVSVILPGYLPRGLVLPERIEGSLEHVGPSTTYVGAWAGRLQGGALRAYALVITAAIVVLAIVFLVLR